MERKPVSYRLSPTGEYFGLFVRGDGESRNGTWKVTDALILHGSLYTNNAEYSTIKDEAEKMRIRGIPAEVRKVQRGETIVVREIPENCITAMEVE